MHALAASSTEKVNEMLQTYLRVQQEESAASKLAEKDMLLRLLPRDRMYQV